MAVENILSEDKRLPTAAPSLAQMKANALERIATPAKLQRKIVDLPRDKDDMFVEPDKPTPEIATMLGWYWLLHTEWGGD